MTGYKVYARQSGAAFGPGIDVGNPAADVDGQIHSVVTGMASGVMNYFAVSAYNSSGSDSVLSNELSLMVPPTPAPTGTSTAGNSTATATQTAINTANPPPTPSAVMSANPAGTTTPTPTSSPNGPITPVAAYSFSEGGGSTTADASAGGHTGTLSGSPVWTAGRYGNGLQFSGGATYDCVNLAPANAFDALTQGTLEAWVKFDPSAASYRIWFNASDASGCSYPFEAQLNTLGGTVYWEVWAGDTPQCTATFYARVPLPNPDQWHHLAYVVGASGNAWYVDGVQQTPTYLSGSAASTFFFASAAASPNTQYSIGCTDYQPEGYKGIIDELRIYDRPLTQMQIQADMNAPIGSVATATSSPSASNTAVPTATRTASATATVPPTSPPPPTATSTSTASATHTATATPTNTPPPTATATATYTASVTRTPSATSSSTATNTLPPTATATSSASPSPPATGTRTATATATPTYTLPPTATATASLTMSPSATATRSATPTLTYTVPPTSTATSSASATPTRSASATATAIYTSTATASRKASATAPPTNTATATQTPLPSSTATASRTQTAIASATATATAPPAATSTALPSVTRTATASTTPTATSPSTATATATFSATALPTVTSTASRSATPSPTQSLSPTPTVTPIPSWSVSISADLHVMRGGIVSIPINIATGSGVRSFALHIAYDPSVVTVQDVQLSTDAGPGSLDADYNTPGDLAVAATLQQPMTGSGALVNVTLAATDVCPEATGLNITSCVLDGAIGCQPSDGSLAVACGVGGRIRYRSSNAPVGGALVAMTGPQGTMMAASDEIGQFGFGEMAVGTWQLQPRKLGDSQGAVSALDAAFLLQAVAGSRQFDPIQRLTCDVTGNGQLSALDAARILQFAVGKLTRLPVAQPCGSDWAFIPEPANLPNQRLVQPQLGASCQPGSIVIDPLLGDAPQEDFIAALFGDCSGNWTSAAQSGANLSVSSNVRVRLGVPRARPGGQRLVPLYVATSNPFLALDARLTYDQAAVLSNVHAVGAARGAMVEFLPDGHGGVSLALASATPLVAGSGPIAVLVFDAPHRRTGTTLVRLRSAAIDESAAKLGN